MESQLTMRETQILKYIVDELSSEEIAEKLNLSPRTVATHRENMMNKLGIHNTVGLVKYALLTEIVSLHSLFSDKRMQELKKVEDDIRALKFRLKELRKWKITE